MIFAIGENETGDIVFWIIPLSGENQSLLELDVSVEGKPFPFAVSPDVKKLAFSVDRSHGMQDLFVVPISLKDSRTIGPAVKVFDEWYRSGGYNVTASWSPDGSKLAVIHRGDVWIAFSNGNKPIQITKTLVKEGRPGWSPDGKMVNYSAPSNKNKSVLYVVTASGNKIIKKVDDCSICAWSPNNKEFATSSNEVISIIPITGGVTKQIVNLKDLGLDRVFDLSWSPDGKKIAFIGDYTEKDEASPIFVISAKGGKVNELAVDDLGWKFSLDWSQDGKWISYTTEAVFKTRPEGTMWEVDFEEVLEKLSD